MAIVRVQNATGSVNAGTSIPVTLSPAPVNGNSLFAVIGLDSNVGSVSSITQTGATWALITQFQDSGSLTAVEIWGCANVVGASTSITVNLSVSLIAGCVVAEYSGMPSTVTLDKTNNNSVSSGATQTDSGLTAITTLANELWITGTCQHAAVSPLSGGVAPALITPSSGYTLVDQIHVVTGASVQQWRNTGYMDNIVTSVGTAGNTCSTDRSGGTTFRYTCTAVAMNGPATTAKHFLACLGVGT